MTLPAAPKTMVLAYINDAHNPTRTRQVASRAVLVVGGVEMLMAMLIAALVVMLVHAKWPLREDELAGLVGFVGALLFWLAAAVVHLSCAAAVGIGRRGPAIASMVGLVVPGLACVGVATVATVLMLMHLVHRGPQEEFSLGAVLLMGLVAVLGVLGAVLLIDLAAYLRWISKAPVVEAPKRKFVG